MQRIGLGGGRGFNVATPPGSSTHLIISVYNQVYNNLNNKKMSKNE